MYIINDIDLLKRLGRHKILDFMLTQCEVAISAVRLTDYTLLIKRDIEKYPTISVINVDQEFSEWTNDKRTKLSIGDLSSIYVAMRQPGSTLVISTEDIFIEEIASKQRVSSMHFDEFIIGIIKDEKTIQLYNLIKVA